MRLIDADVLKSHIELWNVTDKELINHIIDIQPNVDPFAKRGKWVLLGRLPCDEICECSNCGDMSGDITDAYCRKCGAKMEGIVEDDDIIDMRRIWND